MEHNILIVEDDSLARDVLKELLQKDYSVATATDGECAIEMVGKDGYSLIITDLKLPGMNGIEVIRKVREISPETVSIVLTGYGTIESAVEAMKEGAFHYLTKPFRNDDLLLNVKRAIEYYELKKENLSLREEIQKQYSFDHIVGKSQCMLDIYEMIKKVADTDSTVILYGESGTGKELIAKAIHYNSSRSQYPFIPVNCGAIPGELLESELFGYEKGAFTGALTTRKGRFERAHKGTIFLDEVGELALHLQVKLLRVIQEKEFERVGGDRTIQVDARIIAATNRDLEEAVENRKFRKDLYYRLNVIPIYIPPLRERREDIPLLLNHFIELMAKRKKRRIQGISDEAMEIFLSYSWPGNIRELENIIERIVILKQDSGPIVPDDIPHVMKKKDERGALQLDIPHSGINLTRMIEDLEKEFIVKALNKTGGVKSKAAELLGINRTTLIEKMRKKGMLSVTKD